MINDVQIVKALLLFYVITCGSLIQPLLSKRWTETIQNNRLIQHMIGLTTLIALVTLVSEGKADYAKIIIYSLIGYIWFLFSTKMDIHWNVLIFILLLIAYLYQNSLISKEIQIENDRSLSSEEKYNVVEKNNRNNLIVILGLSLVTIVGTLMYSNKKDVQYGGGYSVTNFLLY